MREPRKRDLRLRRDVSFYFEYFRTPRVRDALNFAASQRFRTNIRCKDRTYAYSSAYQSV